MLYMSLLRIATPLSRPPVKELIGALVVLAPHCCNVRSNAVTIVTALISFADEVTFVYLGLLIML